MQLLKGIIALVLLLLQTTVMRSQSTESNPTNYDNMSLEELMNVKITVASIKELTPRQSPGIITYITAEEIRNLGARDLMEVLRQVPGFEFGVDVEGVVGIAVRGNWAHEGKVVLFIDGIEMNESLYSTLQLGSHYPVDNIERIEIIRGPGSALHGGYAAYAVIKIITKAAKTGSQDIAGQFSQSTTQNGISNSNVNLYYSKKTEKSGFSIKLNGTKSLRSHSLYKDVYGNGYDMSKNSDLKNIFINVSGNIGKLQLRIISDNYTIQGRDNYVAIANVKSICQFTSNNIEAKYEIKANKKFKIIPRIVVSKQYPWSTPKKSIDVDTDPFLKNTVSILGAINTVNDFNENINLSSGITLKRETSTNELENEVFQTTGTNKFINENISLFSQALFSTKWFNITGGLRFNYNKRYENALVPRIGITREFRTSHIKALYSRAFRAPSTENIDLGFHIRPEFTDVMEIEGGFKITSDAYITINAFHMQTRHPIVYYVEPITDEDAYTNLSSTGSDGIEMVVQIKKKWGGVDINGSFYNSKDGDDVQIYSVPGKENTHLGLAKYKANFSAHYLITSSIQVGSNLNWLSPRYGIGEVYTVDEIPVYTKYPSFVLLNAHIEYRVKKIKGLTIRFGIRNILNDEELFIQPYSSNHAPLPGMQREYQLKITLQNF
ncbi:MAG: TonB-dependent receptor [Bacteroidia bacterium]|jgi:outer membrane cobalamin receptor|nr:TonB-dependent receptor [Bacteroidia bacterium]MBP7244477.1 TonB-dependent receptor [Bacteroidia bacterium]